MITVGVAYTFAGAPLLYFPRDWRIGIEIIMQSDVDSASSSHAINLESTLCDCRLYFDLNLGTCLTLSLGVASETRIASAMMYKIASLVAVLLVVASSSLAQDEPDPLNGTYCIQVDGQVRTLQTVCFFVSFTRCWNVYCGDVGRYILGPGTCFNNTCTYLKTLLQRAVHLLYFK